MKVTIDLQRQVLSLSGQRLNHSQMNHVPNLSINRNNFLFNKQIKKNRTHYLQEISDDFNFRQKKCNVAQDMNLILIAYKWERASWPLFLLL